MKFDPTRRKNRRKTEKSEKWKLYRMKWILSFAFVLPTSSYHRRKKPQWFGISSIVRQTSSTLGAILNRLFIRWGIWFNRFFGEHVFCGHTFKLFSHYNRIRNRAENLFSPPFSTFAASFVRSFFHSEFPVGRSKRIYFFYWQFNGIIVFEIFNIFRCSNDVLTALPVFEWLL